jgi:ethanolamine utilization protein EutP
MKKLILVGRSESGKTTLTQVLKGGQPRYQKTQYVNYHDVIIDTPGEYAENRELARALALYSYEADMVGLLLSATEQYSLYSPCCTAQANREVIGIVTKIDRSDANPEKAAEWLKLAGCKEVFLVSAYTGEGIEELTNYLKKDKKQQKNTETQKKSQKSID